MYLVSSSNLAKLRGPVEILKPGGLMHKQIVCVHPLDPPQPPFPSNVASVAEAT